MQLSGEINSKEQAVRYIKNKAAKANFNGTKIKQ